MTFKFIVAIIVALGATILSSGAVAEPSCEQVEESAAKSGVVLDAINLYVAARAETKTEQRVKEVFNSLNKRLIRYWLTETGYKRIRVVTEGAVTKTMKCGEKVYYALYVPIRNVKIYEDRSSVVEGEESNQSIAEQFFLQGM